MYYTHADVVLLSCSFIILALGILFAPQKPIDWNHLKNTIVDKGGDILGKHKNKAKSKGHQHPSFNWSPRPKRRSFRTIAQEMEVVSKIPIHPNRVTEVECPFCGKLVRTSEVVLCNNIPVACKQCW